MKDMSDLGGLQEAKRVLEIAAAGGHSVLLLGALGSGRTALAQRVPGILAPLAIDLRADLHCSKDLYGAPFRAPHHTTSRRHLLGDSKNPSEVDLAKGGVLFLDELDEFYAETVDEVYRLTYKMPLRPIIIGAMSSRPCGRPSACTARCTAAQKARHEVARQRLSNIFDCTFDLAQCTPATTSDKLETSATIRERVIAAREFGFKVVRPSTRFKIGARAYQFATTIANLALSEDILPSHVEEALRITHTGQYEEP